jgi:hypothetical protein
VVGVDHNWRPTARWNVRTRVFGSDIDSADESARDYRRLLWADYEMDHGWRQQVIAMHFGNDLADQRRGLPAAQQHELPALRGEEAVHRAAKDSRYSSKDWRWRVSSDYNDRGDLLNHQFRISRESNLHNGSYDTAR